MAAGDIVPVPGAQFEETLASASPDLLREMIRGFAQRMMDADVEVRCRGYGEVSPERVNSRNGYRRREWDTRAGTVELAIPKLRHGSYFRCSGAPPAGRAGAGLGGATSYLLGVSTQRVEKLAESLGVTSCPSRRSRDGGGAGRAGRGVPEPAAGCAGRTCSGGWTR